jgi:flagellar assembly protein FliH
MKCWSDRVALAQPLRDVRLRCVMTAAQAEQDNVEERVRTAYERGRIEGEQVLSEQLVQQRSEMQELLHGVLHSLQASVPQILRDSEQMMVRLALEIAQKIVADVPISAELVEAAVHDALSQVEGTSEMIIRLHPADLELLLKINSALLRPGAGMKDIRFQGSAEVTRGGCLVETRFGILDGRRETKFDLLKRSLLP